MQERELRRARRPARRAPGGGRRRARGSCERRARPRAPRAAAASARGAAARDERAFHFFHRLARAAWVHSRVRTCIG